MKMGMGRMTDISEIVRWLRAHMNTKEDEPIDCQCDICQIDQNLLIDAIRVEDKYRD